MKLMPMLNKSILSISILTIVLLIIVKYSSKEDIHTLYNHKTPSFIHKNNIIFYKHRMESSPIVFENKIYDVISNRMSDKKSIEIYDTHTKNIVSSTNLDIGLASALVYKKELYVLGSTNWQASSALKIYKTSDLVNFIEVGLLNPEKNMKIFNSSLIHNNKKFILSIETSKNNDLDFNPIFYESADLKKWKKISEFKFTNYIACPTLRFINGVYYIFYLLHDKNSNVYYTTISKSKNLVSWTQSNKVVLAPDGPNEGQNNSDMDLYEHNKEVILNYAIGNQDSIRPVWTDIKKATYSGTMESFVNEFF